MNKSYLPPNPPTLQYLEDVKWLKAFSEARVKNHGKKAVELANQVAGQTTHRYKLTLIDESFLNGIIESLSDEICN